MKSPSAGMNVSSVPGEHPGERQRERHLAERGGAAGVEVGRGLDEPPVDLLERHVQRQRHEGQEVVGDARDDRRPRGQQAAVVGDEPDVLRAVQDPPVVGEDRLPGDGPDDVAREERQDDEQQQDVLPAPGLEGDEVRQRERDDQAQHGRRRRVAERALQLARVVRDRVRVDGPVERLAEPRVRVAGLQRDPQLVDDRDGEEHDEPQHAGRQQDVRQQGAPAAQREHAAGQAPVTFCICAVSSRSSAGDTGG